MNAIARARAYSSTPSSGVNDINFGRSAPIRVHPRFRLREYGAAMSGTVDSFDKSSRASGIMNVNWRSLFILAAAMG